MRSSASQRSAVETNNQWNDRANVSAKELEALQAIAADLLKLSSTQLDAHVEGAALLEICHDSEK